MLYLCHAAAFIISLSCAVVFLALPLLAIERFGALNFGLGLLGAACAGVYIGTSLLSGRISERLSIRVQLSVSTFILGVTFCTLFYAPSFALLVLLNVINGIAMGLMWAPLEAVVSRLSRPGRVRANMGWYNLAWSAGMTVGFFLFALVETWAFHFGAALVILTGLMFLFLRAPNAKAAPLEVACSDGQRSIDGRRRLFLLASWSSVFAAYVGIGAARQLFPKLATDLEIAPAMIGYIYGVGLAAQTVAMAVMGRFGGWHYKKITIYLGDLGLVVAGLLIALGHEPIVLSAGHVVLGVAISVLYSSSLYYSMENPADAHRNTSVHEGIIGVSLTTPLLMGYAADRFHGGFTPLSFYIAAAVALLLLGVHIVMFARGTAAGQQAGSARTEAALEEDTKKA